MSNIRVSVGILLLGTMPWHGVSADDDVDFSRDILPILSDNCFHCHGPDAENRPTELRLDEEANAKQVRDGLAAIVPGDSKTSEAFRRINSSDPDEVMPPSDSQRSLTAAQIERVRRWIDSGASWEGHWAYRSLREPALPAVAGVGSAAQHPIDRFVVAHLEGQGLEPSAASPRATLIRRVTLDLTGLPPTPSEVDAFLQDNKPGAYSRVVDRLLASPAFGERMAWDWLDAARYADSNGYQGDADRTMWPWRDWVVRALNANLPHDQFTVWQLAGDLLPDATDEQKLATGFCRNHMINGEGGRIAEENRIDYVMDMTETMGTVWLGLTLNCCRCHDHKFDPLTRRDYYSLFAFFNQTPVNGGGGNPQTPPVLEWPSEEQRKRLAELDEAIAAAAARVSEAESALLNDDDPKSAVGGEKLPEAIVSILQVPPRNRRVDQLVQLKEHWKEDALEYVKHVEQLRAGIESRAALQKSLPRVMIMEDLPKPRTTFMLDKGLYDKPGETVTAAVPASLPDLAPSAPRNRLGLARWLIAEENPLTARVAVNRFWQQFFGVGLVKSAEDFGVQGEQPVYRELLDWVAFHFRESDWDVKSLCRLIVTSATYQQSSVATAEQIEQDPQNRLLARGPRHRLPAWMIRDQALAASGLLVHQVGGPPVRPYQPADVWAEATFGKKRYEQDKGDGLYRRSLYTFWRRIVGPTTFFDSASRQTCTVKQARTNTPLHALVTMNDVTYVEAARALAQRAMTEGGSSTQERIARAFRLVVARRPSAAEAQVLSMTLDRLRQHFADHPEAAARLLEIGQSECDERLDVLEHASYAALCSSILNLDETLTKE